MAQATFCAGHVGNANLASLPTSGIQNSPAFPSLALDHGARPNANVGQSGRAEGRLCLPWKRLPRSLPPLSVSPFCDDLQLLLSLEHLETSAGLD